MPIYRIANKQGSTEFSREEENAFRDAHVIPFNRYSSVKAAMRDAAKLCAVTRNTWQVKADKGTEAYQVWIQCRAIENAEEDTDGVE